MSAGGNTSFTFVRYSEGMIVNRLRIRLMASYLVVLLGALGVISVLLVLLLRGQPVPVEPIYQRLTTIARTIGQSVDTGMLGNMRPERITQTLDRVASRQHVRLILAGENGTVLYDSSGTFQPGENVDYHLDSSRPSESPSQPGQSSPLRQGSFEQEREVWLFVAQDTTSRLGTAYLLAAAPHPQSSWSEVLNLFGSSLLIPVVQTGLAGLLIAFGLAWLVSRGIVGPLHRLRHAAQAIAAGDYGERVPARGPDEVRDVASAFNHMAEQVQATQIAQHDFLANVSHDLRTPLTSIQGFSQAIIDGTSKDPAYHARIIRDEAGRLNRLVSELLDLARISVGRLSMRHEQLNLVPLVEHVTEGLAIKARESGVQLVRDIQPVPNVSGDGDRLAQVLTNLVDNALKFTPEGGTVRVGLQSAGGGVQLTVSDTGQGIPPEELPRVFERFYQVDKARGPGRGSGLGLAITAEIVQAHGGRIQAASGGAGKGTTFTVWLPAFGMSTVVRRAG